ncbi:MAG: DUF5050 domain-containing protein [Lachnospiraceae bacterium]|nr:DUF5050 domain-containing protein [Lachnospiraceae bacterium]
MSGKLKGILIITILLILFIGGPILSKYLQRVPENPEGTVGNLAGNLNNRGLFCETEDKIYFANAYDNDRLYSMNKDETEIKKLANVSVEYLCSGGNYLYYHQSSSKGGSGLGYVRSASGLYRMDLKRKAVKALAREGNGMVQLVNNEVYYQYYKKSEDNSLYSYSLDGKSNISVIPGFINPSCVWNNQIYYTDTADARGLYVFDPVTKTSSLHTAGNIWFPQILDSYVYYMDASNDYCLCRFLLSDAESTVEILTTDRVDTFLVFGSMIYYQKNDKDAPALMRMGLDGSNHELVAEGNYENLNGAANYVYFNQFGESVPIYHTPAFGPVQVSEFEGAKTAALENINDGN